MITETLKDLGLAELRAMRAEAVGALQRMMLGENIVTVSGLNGVSTTYQAASVGALKSWVGELSAAIRELETGQAAVGPILPEYR
jgi:hypothetical protein